MSSLRRWVEVGQGEFRKWTEKGQELEGTWLGQHEGKFGPLGALQTEQGKITFPLHMALLQRVEGLAEGTYIQIVYTGMHMSKGGKEFKGFIVRKAEGMDPKPSTHIDEASDEVPF